MKPLRRLPLRPLLERLGTVYVDRWNSPNGLPTGYIAEQTGFCERTVQRWHSHGLPVCHADVVAVAFGFHPLEIWPEWDEAHPPERHTTAVECPQAEKEGTEDG